MECATSNDTIAAPLPAQLERSPMSNTSRTSPVGDILPIAAHPELAELAAAWFSDKWAVPVEEYRKSMLACCDHPEAAVPQWYVVVNAGRIVAGAGVIDNDFHERRDLAPNVCAVFVEPELRKLGIARRLLDFVCRDIANRGVERLYLLTDHNRFYERLGWRFREMVRDDDGLFGRMYEKELRTANAFGGVSLNSLDSAVASVSASTSATRPDNALDRKLAENRDNWDDRAAVHAESAFYEVERLVSDPAYVSGVAQRDFEALSPHLPQAGLAGLSVLHLQCHIGTDTISWLRLGAREAWGLDFSPASLSHARSIARRAGANATFVEGDARFASNVIDRTFDVVVTGTGAITWFPDLGDWARSIADLLVPGGVFLLRDDHPLLDALGYESLTITEDYLGGRGSIDYESDGSYVEGSAGRISHTANHNWRHDFQEIVGSLLAAGLSIETLRESPYTEWKALPFLVETKQGWTMPEGMPRIPLSFAVVARKPQKGRMN